MSEAEYWRFGLAAATDAITGGTLTARAFAEGLLARVAATDPAIDAWAHIDPQYVRAEADRCDAQDASKRGPLFGVGIGVKDIIATADQPTQMGSPIHAGHRPQQDAECVARLTRASFLELRDREFVLAARALGAGDGALIGRHILPNTLAPLIVQATISFPVAILAEAALSYLGLGTQPPHPSWGLMLREAQAFLVMAPGFAIFPGTAIALTVLGLNLLGDGLRDLLDPKMAG